MKPGSLMGRLANGNEADQGRLVHAVPDTTTQYGLGRAACGAKPGRRSGGWDVDHYVGGGVTCIRCVSRLQRAESK
jgi:hypothetical protein